MSELAKLIAAILGWPVNDETQVVQLSELPTIECDIEFRSFVTPGGVQFKMGYCEGALIVIL